MSAKRRPRFEVQPSTFLAGRWHVFDHATGLVARLSVARKNGRPVAAVFASKFDADEWAAGQNAKHPPVEVRPAKPEAPAPALCSHADIRNRQAVPCRRPAIGRKNGRPVCGLHGGKRR